MRIYTHAAMADERLYIEIKDKPGAGGAHHHYEIGGFDINANPTLTNARRMICVSPGPYTTEIYFQNGPIKEHGVNGVTQEALMAICIDRLESFQAGPFACKENATALWHLKRALEALHSRTKERQSRGVEGTLVK